MEVVDAASCEDEVLLQSNTPQSRLHRYLWPALSAAALVTTGGLGGRAVWNSFQVDDVTSLHSHHSWYSAWRSHEDRRDAHGCTWDGDDCRASRCCRQEGSRCFVKNSHWASCNESCSYNVKWGAGLDGRGRWFVTNHPEWSCADLTITPVTAAPVTVAPVTEAPATAAPVTAAPSTSRQYSIYQSKVDTAQTVTYGPRSDESSRLSSVPSPKSDALVRWTPP